MIIDVWDVATFDADLRGRLDEAADLIRDYELTSRRQWLEREASDHRSPYPENPFADSFMRLREAMMPVMERRTIRAWHYTRMTDAEVALLQRDGIRLSSLEAVRARIDAQVAAGAFDGRVADKLFADSPFQSDQRGSRSGKFWMVSHPVEVGDGGVELLLESWGGEGAYFWQRDTGMQELLRGIGKPRVIEIAKPLSCSPHSFSAGEAVVAAYACSMGWSRDTKAFDLYTHEPLGPECVLAVHADGDAAFASMARGYPADLRRYDG